jgi:membrane fusion protein (multidrug efflux system)
LVEVSPVIEREVITKIELVGTGEPYLESVVVSDLAGIVNDILVEEGDLVSEHQSLCVLESPQLKSEFEDTRARLAESRVSEKYARNELARKKRFLDSNSISEEMHEDERLKVEAATKKTARFEAKLWSLKEQMDNMIIKTPVTGYVVERHCTGGQWIAKGDPFITIVIPDPIIFVATVLERYISQIKKGDTVDVRYDALRNRDFRGMVDGIIPEKDEDSGTFLVRIKITNPEGLIDPEMSGRVMLPTGEKRNALLVPKDAIMLNGTNRAVFIIIDGIAQIVSVAVGDTHDTFIEVIGDLEPGLNVVIRGKERLRSGQSVKLMDLRSSG